MKRPEHSEHPEHPGHPGHSGPSYFGGREGRISTRLGRLRAGYATRSSTACATSSAPSFHDGSAPGRPPTTGERATVTPHSFPVTTASPANGRHG